MFGIGCSELVVDQTSQFNDTWKSAPITLSVGEVMSYGEPWRTGGIRIWLEKREDKIIPFL